MYTCTGAVSNHHFKGALFIFNLCINTTFEMMSNTLTNAGKHLSANIACACSHQYTKDSVF